MAYTFFFQSTSFFTDALNVRETHSFGVYFTSTSRVRVDYSMYYKTVTLREHVTWCSNFSHGFSCIFMKIYFMPSAFCFPGVSRGNFPRQRRSLRMYENAFLNTST